MCSYPPPPTHAHTCTQEEGAWACSLPFSLPAERAQGGQDRRGPWPPALRRSFLRARGRCRGQEASPVCARIVLSAPDTASFTQNRAGDRPSAPHSGTQRPPPPPLRLHTLWPWPHTEGVSGSWHRDPGAHLLHRAGPSWGRGHSLASPLKVTREQTQ